MEANNLVAFVVVFMFISTSNAYYFYVGGSSGWTVNPSESFNQWAVKNRFQVNDKLVFNYNKAEDSVLLVNKQDYELCNTNNPIKRMDESSSVFRFDRSGQFFFIGGTPGRCREGEKMVVDVLAVRGSRRAPLPTVLPSLPPVASALSPSPGGSGAVGGFESPAQAPSPAVAGSSPPAVTASRVLFSMVLLCVFFV